MPNHSSQPTKISEPRIETTEKNKWGKSPQGADSILYSSPCDRFFSSFCFDIEKKNLSHDIISIENLSQHVVSPLHSTILGSKGCILLTCLPVFSRAQRRSLKYNWKKHTNIQIEHLVLNRKDRVTAALKGRIQAKLNHRKQLPNPSAIALNEPHDNLWCLVQVLNLWEQGS